MPSLYGAEPILFSRFAGFCPDVDPAELEPFLAADLCNLDCDGERLTLRRGRTQYNNVVKNGAGRVLGLWDWYPADGSGMIGVMAGSDGKVYANLNRDNDFDDDLSAGETLISGLSTSALFTDFWSYRGNLYGGNGVDAPWKWNGVGIPGGPSAFALTAITAPVAPAPASILIEIENFDSAGGSWTAGPSSTNLTIANDTTDFVSGTASTKLEASNHAGQSSYNKNWSAGTQDLSPYRWLQVRAKGTYGKIGFKVVPRDDDSVFNYDLFPTLFTVRSTDWQTFYVPLDVIPPSKRTASAKLAVQWIARSTRYGFPQDLWLDRCVPLVDLPPDRYSYYTSYYNGTSKTESSPSPAAVLTLTDWVSGIVTAVTGSTNTAVTKIFLYRTRDTGPFRVPLKVGEVNNVGVVTLSGAHNSSTATITPSSVAGFANGDVIRIDSEYIKIGVVGVSTFTGCTRGWYSSTAASHTDTTPLYLTFFDARDDGAVLVAQALGTGGTDGTDGQEMRSSLIVAPIAQTYCLANDRLFAGNVIVGGVADPYAVYVSRQAFPEEFASLQRPGDPTVGGWFRLETKDPIKRLIEFDGQVLIFTDRSVWTVEGTGFDDFVVAKRADVGLVAREAVCVSGRLVYFLSGDGFRVLAPNSGADRPFDTWLISEPVRSRLQAVPQSSRSKAACGVDDLGRVHLTLPATTALGLAITTTGQLTATVASISGIRVGDILQIESEYLYVSGMTSLQLTVQRGWGGSTAATHLVATPVLNLASLVFDPRQGGLSPGLNPKRPGWTYYAGASFSCARTTKNGAGGQSGGMLCGDPVQGYLWRVGIDAAGADLVPETNGIPWFWVSAAVDSGPGQQRAVPYLQAEFGPSGAQRVRLELLLDEVELAASRYVVVSPVTGTLLAEARQPASARAKRLQVRLDSATSGSTEGAAGTVGFHTAALVVRSAGFGVLGARARG
jgi:hypothetical protein